MDSETIEGFSKYRLNKAKNRTANKHCTGIN